MFKRKYKTFSGFKVPRTEISEFEDKYLHKIGREIPITILTNDNVKYCRIYYPDTEDKGDLGIMLINLGTQLIGQQIKEIKNENNNR